MRCASEHQYSIFVNTGLQACQPETPEKQKALLLQLARSLLERAPSTPYHNEDTMLLYIKILREIGGPAVVEALTILTPDMKAPFLPNEESSVPLELQEEAHRKEDRAKRDTVKRWMTDLRFRWERWEMVEDLAKAGNTAWNWEEEFVRADDAIRGAEDTP